MSERLEEIRIIRNRERIESERNELRGHLRRHGPHRAGRSASCRREMRPQIEAGVFQLVQRQPPGRLLCSLQESRFCGRGFRQIGKAMEGIRQALLRLGEGDPGDVRVECRGRPLR